MIIEKQEGEDRVWYQQDRGFGGGLTEMVRFKDTGDVYVSGVKHNGPTAVLSTTALLTATQVKALHATPIQAIPAPPTGKYIEIVSMHAKLVYGTAAYDSVGSGDFLELRYTNGSGALLTATVDPTGFADATADAHVTIAAAASGWIPANAKVMAYIATGEWYAAAGDSALHLEILYRLRDLGI